MDAVTARDPYALTGAETLMVIAIIVVVYGGLSLWLKWMDRREK